MLISWVPGDYFRDRNCGVLKEVLDSCHLAVHEAGLVLLLVEHTDADGPRKAVQKFDSVY